MKTLEVDCPECGEPLCLHYDENSDYYDCPHCGHREKFSGREMIEKQKMIYEKAFGKLQGKPENN